MKTKILSLLLTFILVVSLLCACSHEHYFYEDYSRDDVNHWFECGGCGEKKDVEAHTWDDGTVTTQPTENSEGERTFTCTVCGQTRVEKIDKLNPDHNHVYNKLNNDANGHWNECDCGDKANSAAHSDGNGDGKCDTCQYDVPVTGGGNGGSGDDSGLGAGAIVGIVIGSVAVAGIGGFAIFWFVIKKKTFADLVAIFKKK